MHTRAHGYIPRVFPLLCPFSEPLRVCLLLVIPAPFSWHIAVLMYSCTFKTVLCETELAGIVPMNMHLQQGRCICESEPLQKSPNYTSTWH